MSVPLDDVVAFLDAKLETHKFDEVGSNGLVLRSLETVSRVACAVNTSFHAIARAKFTESDLLIVHHRTWPEIDLELVPQKLERSRTMGSRSTARTPRSTARPTSAIPTCSRPRSA